MRLAMRVIYLVLTVFLGCFSLVAEKKPNIIFILTDDQRFDFLGCAGHPVLKTPNIDDLAKKGTRFTNMFVTTSTCWISRASIFSGLTWRGHRYPYQPFEKWVDTTYPAMLKKNGYNVGYVGKHHVKIDKAGIDKMFDEMTVLRRGPFFKEQADGSLRHLSEITGDHAIEFLKKQKKNKPFSLSVSFNASHAEDSDKVNHFPFPKAVAHLYKNQTMPEPPLGAEKYFKANPDFLQDSMHTERFNWRWNTPEKYQHNMRNYLRMISGVDHVIGRVLEQLKKLGLDKNTIIIYSADNGYYAGNRNFAGKWTHYEESLRVPLVIYDPRNPANSSKLSPKMALNIDIPATILDYAQVDLPSVYQGKSLKGLVEGDTKEDWRKETLIEFISTHGTIPNYEGIRGERYVYTRYIREKPHYEFLHDLKRDPTQLKNFANNPEYKEILVQMRKKMNAKVKSLGGALTEHERNYVRQSKKKK